MDSFGNCGKFKKLSRNTVLLNQARSKADAMDEMAL
jgi:hypothetical protein